MKLFRQLPTRRLLALLAAVTAAAAAASFGALAALGSSAQTPPPKPLDQALEDALTAPQPAGITARVRFTNNLFPSGALVGAAGNIVAQSGGISVTSHETGQYRHDGNHNGDDANK